MNFLEVLEECEPEILPRTNYEHPVSASFFSLLHTIKSWLHWDWAESFSFLNVASQFVFLLQKNVRLNDYFSISDSLRMGWWSIVGEFATRVRHFDCTVRNFHHHNAYFGFVPEYLYRVGRIRIFSSCKLFFDLDHFGGINLAGEIHECLRSAAVGTRSR